jgi:hypothetical protein
MTAGKPNLPGAQGTARRLKPGPIRSFYGRLPGGPALFGAWRDKVALRGLLGKKRSFVVDKTWVAPWLYFHGLKKPGTGPKREGYLI